jgi:high-affinity Fe2+/Pb2+ permease
MWQDEWVTGDKNRREGPRLRMTQFALGLIVALTAALLLVLGVIESGWAAVIGMLGIGLIATSQFRSGTESKRHGSVR